MENYRYKLSSTEYSSAQYGNCEVCGKHATEVFIQSEERKYFNPITKQESYTFHKCRNYIGHKECLESKMR
jgi:hypothetical protein